MSKKNQFDRYYALSLVGQVGYTVAAPLIVFILLGVLLDNLLGTKPLFILSGLVLGMVVSFYSLYKLVKPFLRKKE